MSNQQRNRPRPQDRRRSGAPDADTRPQKLGPRPAPLDVAEVEQNQVKVFSYKGQDYYALDNPTTDVFLEFNDLQELEGSEALDYMCRELLVDDAYDVLLKTPLSNYKNVIEILTHIMMGPAEELRGK